MQEIVETVEQIGEFPDTQIIYDNSLLFHARHKGPAFVELETKLHFIIEKAINYRGVAVDATTEAEEAGHAVDDAISEILLYLDSQNIPFT